MRKEIQNVLTPLEIEGKEARKEAVRIILIVVILATTFFLIPYFYPQFSVLYGVFILIMIFGGIVVMDSIGTLYQPLKTESYAFKKIARAIQILEKSKEPIAYEEAYRCLKYAHKILKNIELKDLEWYTKTNQTLKKFLKNLQLIVLPAIASSKIKTEHLEEIALAVLSINLSKIEAVNKALESEPSYKKSKPKPTRKEKFARIFRESLIGKVLISLGFGYGLILGICLIYVFATRQDFMIFARENPEIVVLGGLVCSGITFWRTKPQVSEWKSA